MVLSLSFTLVSSISMRMQGYIQRAWAAKVDYER
jgi:hypothetical protein